MATFKTVLCWIFGIGGAITFLCSFGMPILFAGEYMIVGILVTVSAIYFHRVFTKDEYLSKNRYKSAPTTSV